MFAHSHLRRKVPTKMEVAFKHSVLSSKNICITFELEIEISYSQEEVWKSVKYKVKKMLLIGLYLSRATSLSLHSHLETSTYKIVSFWIQFLLECSLSKHLNFIFVLTDGIR